MIRLILKEVVDKFTQENFKRIESFFREDALTKGNFQFLELVFKKAITRLKVPHQLGFVPLDVLQLSVKGKDTATVTWHYDSFTVTDLFISVTDTCTVRAYIGRYAEPV